MMKFSTNVDVNNLRNADDTSEFVPHSLEHANNSKGDVNKDKISSCSGEEEGKKGITLGKVLKDALENWSKCNGH
eukprot:2007569-Ditylum_brightwellii.AAC.1